MEDAALAVGGSWTILQQLGIQVLAVLIAIVYAGAITLLLLFVVEKTIGLRAKDDSEMRGLDDAYHGERGYGMLNAN
jgi:Amt family ammonium transporter